MKRANEWRVSCRLDSGRWRTKTTLKRWKMFAESQDATHLSNGTFHFSINQTIADKEAGDGKSVICCVEEGEAISDSSGTFRWIDEISSGMMFRENWCTCYRSFERFTEVVIRSFKNFWFRIKTLIEIEYSRRFEGLVTSNSSMLTCSVHNHHHLLISWTLKLQEPFNNN